MHWEDWSPTYRAILSDFQWDEGLDEAAAVALANLIPAAHARAAWRHIGTDLKHRPDAVVVGCGPSLDTLQASDLPSGIVLAADGATSRLREIGITPRVVTTDLDGDPEGLHWAAHQGASMVVHAHGHNQDRLPMASDWPVVAPSCQAAPPADHVRNHGGFTDGDRAVLLCEAMDVRRVRLVAFDLEAEAGRYSHHTDPVIKRRKLAWAARILGDAAERGATRVEHWVPA